MSNKKKNKSAKKHVSLTKNQLVSKIQRTNLKDTLKKVYFDEISLETNMTCKCICCKVAMPQMNYSEFLQMITDIWGKWTTSEKVDIICNSIEYHFKNDFEKWGIQSLVKPCMLQGKDGLCKCYDNRPLSCRLYGVWPHDEYEKRVDRFAKAYEKFGLKREDLPLFNQCPLVERIDKSKDLNMEIISELYSKLDSIDKRIGEFSALEIQQKHNYRTFHDWIMYKVFGSEWLSSLTNFMMAATREQLEDQLTALKITVRASFDKMDELVKDSIGDGQ